MHSRVVLILLLGVLLSGCASMARESPPDVNFSGVWRIDHEMSGNPATLPGIGGSFGKGAGAFDAHLLTELQSPRLHIEQSRTETVIRYDGGMQTYKWGSHDHISSGWEDHHFVVRRPGPGGHMLTRRYILSDEGASMTVVTVFNKMAMTQFYELDKAATRAAFGKLVSEVSDNP